MIDGLGAVEVDLGPVREDTGGGIFPAAVVAPVDAGTLVVVEAGGSEGRTEEGGDAGNATVAGQRYVDLRWWCCIRAPGLDFGEAGERGPGIGDIDANAIGGVGGEVDGALDQVVAADGTQGDPIRAIPPLDGEVGHAIEREGLYVGRLDRAGVVILHRIDDHMIDGLGGGEVDLGPVGEAAGGSIVQATVVDPVDAGTLVVV